MKNTDILTESGADVKAAGFDYQAVTEACLRIGWKDAANSAVMLSRRAGKPVDVTLAKKRAEVSG